MNDDADVCPYCGLPNCLALHRGDMAWLVAALVAERARVTELETVKIPELSRWLVETEDALVAERALSDALAAALETLCNEPTHPYIDEWYNVRKASQAALAAHRSARAGLT